LQSDILIYAINRKESEPGATWEEIATDIQRIYSVSIPSLSGFRSRVAEFKRNQDSLKAYYPGQGVIVPHSEQWGSGLAPLVDQTRSSGWEKYIIFSDIHAPYQNNPLILALMEIIRAVDPDCIINNGDGCDLFQISRWNKDMSRLETLQSELDTRFHILEMLYGAAPNARRRENLGNHDERTMTYISQQAPGLMSLRELTPERLLRVDDLGIELYGRNGFRIREEFLIEHGHIARSDAGASAKARLNATMISGIMGHVHRLAHYPRTGYRNLSWYEGGCLCLPEPDYQIGEANWQPGFIVAEFHTSKPLFNVELVHAVGQGFIYGGRHYGDTTADPIVNKENFVV
jgi:predicted phosphodiesterase